MNAGKPPAPAPAVTPTGPNEPPRSDQPSTAPLQMQAPGEGTGVGVQIVSAPNGAAGAPASPAPADPNALVKPVGPANTCLPAAESACRSAPPGERHQARREPHGAAPPSPNGKTKKPKADLSDESSSKKKKKKGLGKLNPF